MKRYDGWSERDSYEGLSRDEICGIGVLSTTAIDGPWKTAGQSLSFR